MNKLVRFARIVLALLISTGHVLPSVAEIVSEKIKGWSYDKTGLKWMLSVDGVEEDSTGRIVFRELNLQTELVDYASGSLLMPGAFGGDEGTVIYAVELVQDDDGPGVTESGRTRIGEVRIPNSIRTISGNYFSALKHLTNVCFQGDAPAIVQDTALTLPSGCVLSVARGSSGWGPVPGTWNGYETRYGDVAAPVVTTEVICADPLTNRITIGCANLQPGDCFCWDVSFDAGGRRYGTDASPRSFTVTNACTVRAYSVSTWYPQSEVVTVRVGSDKPTSHTVKFDANGGYCSTAMSEVAVGGSIPSLPTATRDGRAFDGWYTAMDGGEEVTTSTEITGNLTLYAHWTGVDGAPMTSVDLTLKPGLTWFSLGSVLPTNGSPNVIFAGCGFSEGDIIKTATESATYHDGSWYPLSFTLKGGKGYLAQLTGSETVSATVGGTVGEGVVALDAGWNWIGSRIADEVELACLLNADGFAEGDRILTQSGGSSYGELGWDDPSVKVAPLIGYRVKVASKGQLTAVGGDAKIRVQAVSMDSQPVPPLMASARTSVAEPWVPVAQANTFILYAAVQGASVGDCLGVFTASGECRGVANYDADVGLFQLSVGVADAGETGFTLRCRSSAGDRVVVESLRNPGVDKTCGAIAAPIALSLAPAATDATTTALPDGETTVYLLTPTDAAATNMTINWPEGSSGFVAIPHQIDVVYGVSAANLPRLRVRNGSYDITECLNFTLRTNGSYAIALKSGIGAEALDTAKGAVVMLDPARLVIQTAPTRSGLVYTFYEGATLESVLTDLQSQQPANSKIGDGTVWTPEVSVKGGAAAFYAIGVGK